MKMVVEGVVETMVPVVVGKEVKVVGEVGNLEVMEENPKKEAGDWLSYLEAFQNCLNVLPGIPLQKNC